MSKSKFFKSVKETVEPEVVTEEVVTEVEVVEVVEPEVVDVPETVSKTNDVAFSMCRNPADNKFYLVKITFDVATKTLGTIEYVGEGVSERYIGIEKFKIEVAKSGMV